MKIVKIGLLGLFVVLGACQEAPGMLEPTGNEPAAASVGPGVLTLSGPNVTRIQTLPEIGRFLVQGTRTDDGGCQAAHETRLGPDTPKEFFRSVVEYDPDTCQYIFAEHDPVLAPDHGRQRNANVRRPVGDGPLATEGLTQAYATSKTKQFSGGGGGGGGGGGPLLAGGEECTTDIGYFAEAFQNLWTVDPVNIEVTRSHHEVLWAYHPGLCSNYMSSYLESSVYQLSGWFMFSGDHDHYYPTFYNGYEALRASGEQVMRNDAFCPGGGNQTRSSYLNDVYGWESGYASFWHYANNSGGCSSLLFAFQHSGQYY